jgi:hypothetical protein
MLLEQYHYTIKSVFSGGKSSWAGVVIVVSDADVWVA